MWSIRFFFKLRWVKVVGILSKTVLLALMLLLLKCKWVRMGIDIKKVTPISRSWLLHNCRCSKLWKDSDSFRISSPLELSEVSSLLLMISVCKLSFPFNDSNFFLGILFPDKFKCRRFRMPRKANGETSLMLLLSKLRLMILLLLMKFRPILWRPTFENLNEMSDG